MTAGNRIVLSIAVALTLVATAGCNRNMSDLKAYVAKVEARKSSKIEPLPKFRTFASFAYVPGDRREPFQPEHNDDAPQHKISGLQPDRARPRQPLEQFPLGSLDMVGTLTADGRIYALIRSPDGIVHRTAAGNYAGQNYGKIIDITNTQIKLIEIIPDGFGGFVKRPASIVMSEK